MMSNYLEIINTCETDLIKHGDCHQGAGWMKDLDEANRRYRVMRELLPQQPHSVSLLDFGCGTGLFLEYLKREFINLDYTGLDMSETALDYARRKFPRIKFINADILSSSVKLPVFDYVVMSGIFTYKGSMSQHNMFHYFKQLMRRLYDHTRIGLAFNVSSKIVDWERDDLFHLSFDQMAEFIGKDLSRHFVVRHDYGNYEYTTYVYRDPCDKRLPS